MLNILEKIEKNPNIPTRCFDTAEKSDFIFRKVAGLQGWNIKKSSDNVDMFDHIDYYVEIPNILDKSPYNISIDIKSAKKFMINPFLILENEWIWIEFKNVNGKEGWLYGKADYIVHLFIYYPILCVSYVNIYHLCLIFFKNKLIYYYEH